MRWDMVIKPLMIQACHDNLRGRVLDNIFWQERTCCFLYLGLFSGLSSFKGIVVKNLYL